MIEHPMDGGESCEMDRLSTVHPGNEHWQRGATTIHRHPRILEDRRRGRSDAANSTSTSRCWPIIIFHYSGEAVHHRSSRGSSATRYHLHEALITCRPTALHRHSTHRYLLRVENEARWKRFPDVFLLDHCISLSRSILLPSFLLSRAVDVKFSSFTIL